VKLWRLLPLCLHVLLGLAICALRFPFIDHVRRGRHVRWWSRRLLRLCAVHLHLPPHAAYEPPALVVANHVSWLDILVLNAWHPCQFVAKLEIRGWPFLGWLSHKVGTVFISRGNRRDVRRVFQGLVDTLKGGERVAFFPEGKIGSQGEILPFHANLFEAAIDAKVPVQAYGLRYRRLDGSLHPATEYAGDISFPASLFSILRAEPIHAELIAAPLIDSSDMLRRDLARAAQQAVSTALGLAAVTQAECDADQ
jgi:1-acyl-sn-glycerol-3-phosphate acyltransferase